MAGGCATSPRLISLHRTSHGRGNHSTTQVPDFLNAKISGGSPSCLHGMLRLLGSAMHQGGWKATAARSVVLLLFKCAHTWHASCTPRHLLRPALPAPLFSLTHTHPPLGPPPYLAAGKRAPQVIKDDRWLKEDFTPTVANRGGALIKKWGRSSAASTAVSIADHLRSLYTPTAPGDCFSTAVCTDGNPYGFAGAAAGRA